MKNRNRTRLALALIALALPVPRISAQSIYTLYAFANYAGLPGVSGANDGTGSSAQFFYPTGVAIDRAGDAYVADYRNSTIRKITRDGTVTTFAGSAERYGSTDGVGSVAQFYGPYGVAVDIWGNVYVADTINHTIRKITADAVVMTLAGSPMQAGYVNGTGNTARFHYPNGVAVDRAGNVFVADSGNHTIRKITSDGIVTTLAGSAGQLGSVDGTGTAARFFYPTGVAVDNSNNIYVADFANSTIRQITPAGVVTTLAGSAGQSGCADGAGSEARFATPTGLAVDSADNVYVADSNNHTVRKITPAGVVTTLAGSAGQNGDTNGIGSGARFSYPHGVAVDGSGNIHLADSANNRITKGAPVGPSDLVAMLIVSIEQSNLSEKIQRPLLASLEAAYTSFQREKITAGVNQLKAFQKKVRAQIGHFDEALADELIRAAQEIIDLVVAKTHRTFVLQPGPADGKDIWTTSVYSHNGLGGGPGGGLDDYELVVGGWGDQYHSLLQFDLSRLPRVAQSAHLNLFCFTQRGVSTAGIFVDRITEFWDWKTQGTGSDRLRLWWADRPATEPWIQQALTPPVVGQWYCIDITDLYNGWQSGTYPNFGIHLRPESNDNRWAEFYSSDYLGDPVLRPKLVVTDEN